MTELIPTLALAAFLAAVPAAAPETSVAKVLDDWHAAAADADEARYFSHLTPEAVFLGTDGTERWTASEFRRFAHPYFAKGKAWSFKPHARHVAFSPDGAVAWFDEALETPNLGPARGSGVLLRSGGEWKIAQYNLSIPIPNDLTKDFKARIEEFLRRSQAPVPSRSPSPSRN
ncbi:MAG: nuclear transport factor 2 family protein [Acidobacteriota bacterium]